MPKDDMTQDPTLCPMMPNSVWLPSGLNFGQFLQVFENQLDEIRKRKATQPTETEAWTMNYEI